MKRKTSQPADEANDQLKLQEMQGYQDLKMKREALRLARYFLKKPKLDGNQFLITVEVIDDFVGRSVKWLPLVEAAYRQLKRQDKEKARRKMLMFCPRKEAVLRYLPKRITYKTDLLELLVTWQIWLENDRMEQLEKTVPVMSKAIQTAASSRTSAWLAAVYAQYWLMRAELFEDDELEKLKRDYLDSKNNNQRK